MVPHPLILASGSRYRAQQLSQLGLAFEIVPPNVDESPQAGEPPELTALRLALAKARAVALQAPNAFIIGSDQTVDCEGQLLGKPITVEKAKNQLAQMSGKEVLFHSAVCLLAPSGEADVVSITTTVRLRLLSEAEIAIYIKKDQPLDCAGSFKVEGLGISLFEWIRSDDPSALIGLPLIALSHMLRRHGINPLSS